MPRRWSQAQGHKLRSAGRVGGAILAQGTRQMVLDQIVSVNHVNHPPTLLIGVSLFTWRSLCYRSASLCIAALALCYALHYCSLAGLAALGGGVPGLDHKVMPSQPSRAALAARATPNVRPAVLSEDGFVEENLSDLARKRSIGNLRPGAMPIRVRSCVSNVCVVFDGTDD